MKPDPRRVAAVATLLACAACSPKPYAATSGPSAAPSPSPTASTAPATPAPSGTPAPGATVPPLRVRSQSQNGHSTEFTNFSHGRKVYVVVARACTYHSLSAEGTGDCVDPHVTFFQKDGKTWNARSPRAIVDQRTKTVRMTGGVNAKTQDGIVLTCDQMTYDDADERVHGTGNVKITNADGKSLTGNRIDADLRFNDVQVSS